MMQHLVRGWTLLWPSSRSSAMMRRIRTIMNTVVVAAGERATRGNQSPFKVKMQGSQVMRQVGSILNTNGGNGARLSYSVSYISRFTTQTLFPGHQKLSFYLVIVEMVNYFCFLVIFMGEKPVKMMPRVRQSGNGERRWNLREQ